MGRFLIASLPLTGHVLPPLPIARKLVERGHEVRWYTGRKFRGRIEEVGARFEPFRTAYDFDDSELDAAFPKRSAVKRLRRANVDFVNLFMKPIGPHYHDLRAILDEFPADVLLADGAVYAASCINEKGGPPYALYCETCLGIDSRDTAPFGMGLPPSRSPLGRLRNRALRFLLKTGRPSADQVRDAVRVVLRSSGYRQHAQRLQTELAQHYAPTKSALLLEQLAATKQPVIDPLPVGEGAPLRAT